MTKVKNKWYSFTSDEIGSFAPGYYGCTILTGNRNIGSIRATFTGVMSAFLDSGELAMNAAVVPEAIVMFQALEDKVIRLVFKVENLQAAPSATALGYIPIIEGIGLKKKLKGMVEDSVIPGFDLYMVGGEYHQANTEPTIKSVEPR